MSLDRRGSFVSDNLLEGDLSGYVDMVWIIKLKMRLKNTTPCFFAES